MNVKTIDIQNIGGNQNVIISLKLTKLLKSDELEQLEDVS